MCYHCSTQIQKDMLFVANLFLNKSFLAMREALSHDDNVIDRSIYEDSMMFHLNADLGRISPMEVEQYDNLLNTMLRELEDSAPMKTTRLDDPHQSFFGDYDRSDR